MTSETNELSDARTWTYSAVGEVTSYTDRNGRVTERDYDGLGRLIEERWKDVANTVNTIEFGYDVASQLGSADDDFSGYAWTYDGLGRTTQTDNSPTPNTPNVVLAHGYDANSRRTSVSAEIDATDDFLNTYAFDNLGRMIRIEQEGQSGGNTVAEKRVDLAYLSDGRFDTITRYADLAGTDLVATSTYGYDDAGRLASLVHAKGVNTLADYSWTYDAHSRIRQFVSPDGTTDYSYDDTHQLTEADFDYQTDGAYAWDLNGNPTGTGYSVGSNNRLLSDGTYDYSYDDEGNLVLRTTISTGDYVEYEWDHRNRLVGVSFRDSQDALQKRVEYDYDLLDRRIGKRVDDDGNTSFDRAERYVYDAEDVVLRFDGGGSLTHRYLHGPGYDQPLADEVFAAGDLFWLLDDNQGTIRDMVEYDAVGDTTSVVNHIEYDAFGRITAVSNSSIDVFYAYTGQEYDADTELVYYGGRWYSPTMRRFLSHDPSGFAAGDANLARYVGNAPTNFVDPTGRVQQANGFNQQMYDAWLATLNGMTPEEYAVWLAANHVPPSFWTDPVQTMFGPDGSIFNAAEDPISNWLGENAAYPVITWFVDNDDLANATDWQLVAHTAAVSTIVTVATLYVLPWAFGWADDFFNGGGGNRPVPPGNPPPQAPPPPPQAPPPPQPPPDITPGGLPMPPAGGGVTPSGGPLPPGTPGWSRWGPGGPPDVRFGDVPGFDGGGPFPRMPRPPGTPFPPPFSPN